MKRLTMFLLLMVAIIHTEAQLVQKAGVAIDSRAKGFYQYTPPGYTGKAKLPLIIAIHGTGEYGLGTATDLKKLDGKGILKYIQNGTFTGNFIVLVPQWFGWVQNTKALPDVNNVINYAIKNFAIDTTRMYLTGLSMGGGATWDYASTAGYVDRLAAIVPICGALAPTDARAKVIRDAVLPVWAFHNDKDPTVTVTYTQGWASRINAAPIPKTPMKTTIFNSSSHDAWTQAYNPAYKENNMNIYDWMLQYRQRSAAPENRPPAVNAGKDTTLNLSAGQYQLTGTALDLDGGKLTYAWTLVGSRPAKWKVSDTTSPNPIFSGFEVGTYRFRLTVTDDQGLTGTDDVSITIASAPVPVKTVVQVITLFKDSTYTLKY